MKIRRAVGGWTIVAGLYFVALLWADSKTGVLRRLPELARTLTTSSDDRERTYALPWLIHLVGDALDEGLADVAAEDGRALGEKGLGDAAADAATDAADATADAKGDAA